MGEGLESSESLRVFDSILGTIGETPLVRLNKVARGLRCSLYAKLEQFNPGGSVKDRIGFPILDAYDRSGELHPGGTVVEATSGNTGVGLAIACAVRGYQAVFVMPDKMSLEKVRLLRAFGARVIITPTAVAPEDPRSYYSVARRVVSETPNAVLATQYHNPENPHAHYATTAPEIWRQTRGRVTDVVVAMGTGGTISGIAQWMRDQGHKVRIVGVDPVGSILYDTWKQGGSAEGLQAFPYKVEGIGEDFIPSTLDLSLVDDVVPVEDAECFHWTRRLVREEGIFCGGSSGAALAGALKHAQDLGPERMVVVIFPDSGSRYLSKVFDDDWMREHGFLETDRRRATIMDVARARGLPTLVTASPSDRVGEVIGRMREHAVSQLPVLDEAGSLVGLVSEVDLLRHLLMNGGEEAARQPIEGIVARDVRAWMADAPFEEVLPEVLASKVIVLLDDLRRPVGILTMIDALDYLAATRE
ncbi:MAG TPA: pyridoxal-phosphate dependent enzyme [Anaerolineales bacterium]|nr:pyridoxal-phosphate dependent enzyme [Anaerolineales bacterium]